MAGRVEHPSHANGVEINPEAEVKDGAVLVSPRSFYSSSSSLCTSPTSFMEMQKKRTTPSEILSNRYYTKDTAFSARERDRFHLRGLLPSQEENINLQVKRCLLQCRACATGLSKYSYLLGLKERNETLFYRVLVENMTELMPFVYTPTVGEACLRFCEVYQASHGLYVCNNDRGKIKTLLDNWSVNHLDRVAIIVISDGSRILGLGDLGANGMGIPVGKSALYVGAGGFHPATVLPVMLDTGTNNQSLLDDELYLGKRHRRLSHAAFYSLLDEFLTAVQRRWPRCLVQFEDFSNDHCFDILEKYRNKMLCFNDDIQGTGAVIAAGFLNALKIAAIVEPRELRIVIFGAGSAAIGVADQICEALQHRYRIPIEECRRHFYLVDSKGLVTETRPDFPSIAPYKLPYARVGDPPLRTLEDVVDAVKPHGLIGLSGQAEQFTESILKKMGEMNSKPIIFPLSNPTANSECTAQAAFSATQNRVVFASGSPFPSLQFIRHDAKQPTTVTPSQGNNMYIFPGLGLGAYLGECSLVSNKMLTAAAIALSDTVTKKELQEGLTYPPLSNVRAVSALVAAATIDCARAEGISSKAIPAGMSTLEYVTQNMYFPDYPQQERGAVEVNGQSS